LRALWASLAATSLMAAACSGTGSLGAVRPAPPPTAVATAVTSAPAAAEPSPAPVPTAAPTPAAVAAAPAAPPPDFLPVSFSGLRPGSYPVHLHTICNGTQSFHITVLGTLGVSAGGSGSIQVASGYFNRGWCVIVYSSGSLAALLTTRPI
jgi:hypothetical protein